MPAGRPTKYDPKYCDDIIAYFDKQPFTELSKKEYYQNGELKSETPSLVANQFPTFQGFAHSIGVNVDTLYEWCKRHEDFSEAFTHAKGLQEQIWLVNGMQNLYNSQFAQFFGKNCLGYTDKQEINTTVTHEVNPDQLEARITELLSKAIPDGAISLKEGDYEVT